MSRGKALLAAIAATLLLGQCIDAEAKQQRSREVTREFQQKNPCPSTGKRSGPCPGYQKDHRHALGCGGSDSTGNLQWLTVEEHARKTAYERKTCLRGAR